MAYQFGLMFFYSTETLETGIEIRAYHINRITGWPLFDYFSFNLEFLDQNYSLWQ